ncbi:hypothetical protein Q9189_007036 [Teloschistes chrysophthalmus]
MPSIWRVGLALLLLNLIDSTWQVSVNLRSEYLLHLDVSMKCPDLAPGECCTAPLATMFRTFSAHVVTFEGLTAWQIAALWRFRDRSAAHVAISASATGCSGQVWRSRIGPGVWAWEIWDEPTIDGYQTPASGGSYIEMPRYVPPDDKVSPWLSAEGVLGLVYGGGDWFSSPAASRILGRDAGVSPKSRLRRDIRSRNRGTVYAGPPRRWTYPTFISVNGVDYTDKGAGNLLYRDEVGQTLNLTQLDERLEAAQGVTSVWPVNAPEDDRHRGEEK